MLGMTAIEAKGAFVNVLYPNTRNSESLPAEATYFYLSSPNLKQQSQNVLPNFLPNFTLFDIVVTGSGSMTLAV